MPKEKVKSYYMPILTYTEEIWAWTKTDNSRPMADVTFKEYQRKTQNRENKALEGKLTNNTIK
jgi:hypothetical protein